MLHLSHSSEAVMRLDFQIILKFPPPNLTGWIHPWDDFLLNCSVGCKKHIADLALMELRFSHALFH